MVDWEITLPRRRSNSPDGGVVIWKPVGPTSRAVIDQVQERLGIDGIGHCGTLDPLASGLMVLIGGSARRFQNLLMTHDKSYEASIWFGIESLSGDAEGPLSSPVPRQQVPGREVLEKILPRFLGRQDQVPPAHSAVRVGSRRSYERARQGDQTPPPSRQVMIHSLSILDMEGPRLRLRVDCGPGTYIRSLARDLGETVGCASSLLGLRRTISGVHFAEDAVLPDRITDSDWLSLEQLLSNLPRVEVDTLQADCLGHGQSIPLEQLLNNSDLDGQKEQRLVVWCQNQIRGIAALDSGELRPRRWIPQRGAEPLIES